jgi:hypothetical protein
MDRAANMSVAAAKKRERNGKEKDRMEEGRERPGGGREERDKGHVIKQS